MSLNADHSGVCKFGQSQTDQDNFELVRCNIEDLYEKALKHGELNVISSAIDQGERAEEVDEKLKERFVKLARG